MSNRYESKDEMVSKPSHYQTESGLETIDVIEAFTADLKGIEAADTANIIKYICRWKKKNGIQDLEKVMWYTQHLMNHVKKEQEQKVKKTLVWNHQHNDPLITKKVEKAFDENGITIQGIIIDEFLSR